MKPLLLSFYGDDFTGSTDAMESLARAGVRTVLFTSPPTRAQLAEHPDIEAFGVAGMTRSMPPDEMEKILRPALLSLRNLGAPIIHYKVCSTFDSSPTIGSIGRVIDVGMDVFDSKFTPVVVGAPALGRYCVFGNLFARCGADSQPFRLDRHPSMSRHPVTPMNESDLTIHLARQTTKKIGLFDILNIESADVADRFARFQKTTDAGLIDVLTDRHLPIIGRLLDACAKPLFIVGSSGVESALTAHWNRPRATFPRVAPSGPILALCGSCSPVTGAQIAAAESAGFASVSFDSSNAADESIRALRNGQSSIIHTSRASKRPDAAQALARLASSVIAATNVRRVAVAGGDTSGSIARALNIQSLEMIGELTRGAPLCRATAPGSPADGIEITSKGGQIGKPDFFNTVRMGTHE